MLDYNLNNRKFTALFNSAHGQVNQETIFSYYQEGENVWAVYSGGEIRIGTISGYFIHPNQLHIRYGHWDADGVYRSGACLSTISTGGDGRIRLHEEWVWDDEIHAGSSTLIELLD